jgi:hypothetical protein
VPSAARWLVVAVAAEFVILRIVNRVTGLFPAWVREGLAVDLVLLGTFAYNVAFAISAVLLAFVGAILVRRSDLLGYAILLWLPLLFVAQSLGPLEPAVIVAADLYAASILAWLVLRSTRETWSERAPVGPTRREAISVTLRFAFPVLVLAAYLGALYLRAGDALATRGLDLPGRPDAYRAAEGFALAAALVAPAWAVTKVIPRRLVLPGLAVGVLAAVTLRRPDLLPLIGFWSLGFQIVLPFGVYLVALGTFVYALVEARASRRAYLVYGLLLVFLGGRLLADYYFLELALVAVAFLSLERGLPTEAPAESDSGAPCTDRVGETRA